MDILDRFIEEFDKKKDPTGKHATPADLGKLVDLQQRLNAVMEPLPEPDIDDDQRKEMQGKRVLPIQDLMFECAEGMRVCDDVARALGAQPEQFETIARLDMSLGGFIKAAEVVQDGADTAMLLTAQEAETMCDHAVERLQGLLSSPDIPDGEKQTLSFAFSEPIRVRQEARLAAEEAARRLEAQKQPYQERLDQLKGQVDLSQLIDEFMTDARATPPQPAGPPPKKGHGSTGTKGTQVK